MGPVTDSRAVHVAVERERERARDGRRRHGEKVGAGALAPERSALVDAKAMLLVDHDERERAELDVVGEDGSGAEDDRDLTARDGVRRDGALVSGRGARDENPADASPVHERTELLGILAGEHRGGRHDGGLGTRVGDGSESQRRDGGLSRADVTQEETVHDVRRRHVRKQLVGGRALLVSERERQRGEERAHMRTIDDVARGFDAVEFDAPAGDEGKLEAEELVIGEATPRGLRGSDGRRKVHLAQGSSEGHEAVRGDETGGQPVRDVADVGESSGHDAAHP